jgi:hypothetical protein
VLEHGAGVDDEVTQVLLEGAGHEANEETWVGKDVPLCRFQETVESTAVCQAVTLLVHQVGL